MTSISMPREPALDDTSVKEALAPTIDESNTTKTVTEEVKTITHRIQAKVEEVKEVEKTVKKEEIVVKKVIPKPTPKPIVKKAVPITKTTTPASTDKTYFIQVGAFKNTPSKRLLSVISSSGFKYQMSPINRAGTKKLLIGPYQSKAQVNQALGIVKSRINKSAFVISK
ncbi:MAG: SPOR domain-containing protein [Sulfurovum sp.]|nr:SPOR domain-containing protein [Sulfurovum sp.]